jgi:hypothetical protein
MPGSQGGPPRRSGLGRGRCPRRRILHFAVTAHPTAEWTVQQLREAFPRETAPGYLLRIAIRSSGRVWDQVQAMGIKQVLSAPRSPWQRAYVERVIGTIRRECLDHVIVFNEQSLRWHLRGSMDCYHRTRTHLGLQKDTPEPRPIQSAKARRVISIPEVGGLHHSLRAARRLILFRLRISPWLGSKLGASAKGSRVPTRLQARMVKN